MDKREHTPAEIESFIECETGALDDGLGRWWLVWKRRRYIVVSLAFFGEVCKEILRTNLSIAVFPMTENHTTSDENGTTVYVQDFQWDVKTRGILLSVFFYGFIAGHIPGGILAAKYGGTYLYGLCIGITSLTTLLTPATANIHFYLLIALRIFEGLCEGFLTPSMELILSRWIPAQERSSLTCIILTGISWGDMVSIAVSSAIGRHWGWPAIFYVTGCIGILWYLAWLIIVKDHPVLEKKILPSELLYIQNSVVKNRQLNLSSIPLVKIITSVPLWALLVIYTANSWNYIFFATQSPAYVKDVLNIDYEKSGYISSLSFVVKVMAIYIISPVADYLITKNILSTTATRKLYLCGSIASIAAMGLLMKLSTSTTVLLGCLFVMNIFVGICHVQLIVNVLDMAPKYSSVLSGILHGTSTMYGMTAPMAVGFLVQNKTAEEWHSVFYIVTAAGTIGAVVYAVFGSGELQPWAKEENEILPEDNVYSRPNQTAYDSKL